MDTQELVELWEKAMPAASRALLLIELERRRYRTKALPAPPPDDARARALPTPEELDRLRMEGSSLLLLVLGFFQLAFGGYWMWALRNGPLVPRLLAAGFPLATGVLFLTLYGASRVRPDPMLTIGFRLYVGLQAFQAVLMVVRGDPTGLLSGIPVTVLVIMGLGYGAAASRRHRAAAPAHARGSTGLPD